MGRGQEAHDHFVLARDLDTMPWRAPTPSQVALREAAQEEGALLCDVEAMFHERSPEEGIGWELMLDHVHPTVQGQALIAEAVVRSMTGLESPLRITEESLVRLKPWEDYATELGASPYDQYLVVRLMQAFFGTPFVRESNPDAFRRYQQQTERMELEQPPAVRRIIQGWNGKVPLNGIIGGALAGQRKFDEAIPLIRSLQHGTTQYSPAYLEALYNEFTCVVQQAERMDELQQRRVQQAIECGTLISDCGLPDSWSVDQTIAHLHLLLEQYDEAIPFLQRAIPHESGESRTFDEMALIRAYLETGQREKARTLALEGVGRGGSYSEVFRQILQSIGN
jgi:tetratricopeptide (TPR) repeat protein